MDKTGGQLIAAMNSFKRPRTIFTTSVPKEVQILLGACHKFDKPTFRKLIKIGLAHLQNQQTEEECEAAFDNICTALNFSSYSEAQSLAEQYSGLLTLLSALLSLNANTVRQLHLQFDLVSLGLKEEQAGDLCRVVYGPARDSINKQLLQTCPRLPALTQVQWQLKTAIAPPNVAHVVEPVLALELHTRHSCHRMSVSLRRFHELRLTVASLLQQMHDFLALPCAARLLLQPASVWEVLTQAKNEPSVPVVRPAQAKDEQFDTALVRHLLSDSVRPSSAIDVQSDRETHPLKQQVNPAKPQIQGTKFPEAEFPKKDILSHDLDGRNNASKPAGNIFSNSGSNAFKSAEAADKIPELENNISTARETFAPAETGTIKLARQEASKSAGAGNPKPAVAPRPVPAGGASKPTGSVRPVPGGGIPKPSGKS
ncbi:uncharacterized protein LOC108678054 [Hyalella azteca]|uniref:COMM domain-containing protein 5 n=1 Tax=Hyalella azteca TaxID=294128 RepID=A0A8B7P6U1_HYAAZ|nr:uncharacterized protein LOC108678054 [Hyalella azteca]